VFIGIALLVYFAFFKLLGIALMVIELGWFLVRPVWSEAKAVWKLRPHLHPRWVRVGAVLAVLLGSFTFLAWSGESRSAGLLMAGEETRLYAPVPARVASVKVQPGQPVKAGDVLLELEAPDLAYRALAAEVRIRRVNGELARIASSERQRDRSLVLQEELAQALSEQQATREEQALLTIRAPHDGRVVDTLADLAPDRWVHPKMLLGRVVSARQAQVRAWVSESQVKRLALGQEVVFQPHLSEHPRVHGRVVRIDTTGSRLLPHPLLGVQHGGDLSSSQNGRGEWELRESLYQVDVQTGDEPAPQTLRTGQLHVPTGPLDAVGASARQLLTVLVRESGF
jgi:putative peptide zinc metalloprotease protein